MRSCGEMRCSFKSRVSRSMIQRNSTLASVLAETFDFTYTFVRVHAAMRMKKVKRRMNRDYKDETRNLIIESSQAV